MCMKDTVRLQVSKHVGTERCSDTEITDHHRKYVSARYAQCNLCSSGACWDDVQRMLGWCTEHAGMMYRACSVTC